MGVVRLKKENGNRSWPMLVEWYKRKLEDLKLKILKEIKALMFLNDHLYKKFVNGGLVKCITRDFGRKTLKKVKSKVCSLEGPILAQII